ncbi:germination protein [Thalassobacillus devorans]|uniref:Germination protein n=1 Tax=Thalassobacillus devorans TaxID=279813 RepID=A0ABQ1PEK2_9BACI|nr:endospore germination permease [Thalassobacillus devorans]NIK29308.1 spore germination protein KB [Thalassobacillus devorans]GGC95674.1 germination protein [Thalassobacillus devorans]
MELNEKITLRQFNLLIILFTIGTSILLSPASLAAYAGNDAWLSAILSVVIGLVILVFFWSVSRQFPTSNLVDISEQVLGKWLGKLAALLFACFSLISAATVLWVIGNFLVTQIMPETPMMFLHFLLMGSVVYGVLLGIEVICRTVEIFFPYIVTLLLIIYIFSVPSIKIEHIQPMLDGGFKPILEGAIFDTSVSLLPLIVLFMVFPKLVTNKKRVLPKVMVSYLIAGTFIIAITFITITVLGVEITANQTYPTYVVAKSLNVEGLIQRAEVVIAVSWLLTIFFKLSLYFYASVTVLAQVLNLNTYRTITVPMGMLTVALSLIVYPSTTYANEWNESTWLWFALTFGIVYPLLLSLIGRVLGIKGKK